MQMPDMCDSAGPRIQAVFSEASGEDWGRSCATISPPAPRTFVFGATIILCWFSFGCKQLLWEEMHKQRSAGFSSSSPKKEQALGKEALCSLTCGNVENTSLKINWLIQWLLSLVVPPSAVPSQAFCLSAPVPGWLMRRDFLLSFSSALLRLLCFSATCWDSALTTGSCCTGCSAAEGSWPADRRCGFDVLYLKGKTKKKHNTIWRFHQMMTDLDSYKQVEAE